ncbi:MAG: hypothetical protein QOH91_1394 [Mycobacterium sp.]|jgi:hypothetical protein|nr:hypothetical protein [Mycobacterium sp.]
MRYTPGAASERGIGANDVARKLRSGGAINGKLADRGEGFGDATQLKQCGPAPAIGGTTQWLNTPDGKPIDLASLRGKVVLIDFWAYSCINCQRAIPHLVMSIGTAIPSGDMAGLVKWWEAEA